MCSVLALLLSGMLYGVNLIGLDAGVFVLLLTRNELTSLWRCRARVLLLTDLEITQIWMMQSLICVIAGRDRTWLFADEFSAPTWSRLRRQLLRQCPVEPVGLSISK